MKFPNQAQFFNSFSQRGIQFKDIADACGVSPQQVNAWTKGKAPVPSKHIKKLSVYLKVSPTLIVDIMAADFVRNLCRDMKIKLNETG
jgi:transcriptional regulator with XRE-family HTH domain